MRLIYHDNNKNNTVSPFDVAIQEVAQSAELIRIASPYIGLNYLLRTIENAKDWRLLSDIEEWLFAGNQRHRALCWRFITENIDKIKHVPGLHAKVAIGTDKLYLGSANFTNKGVLNRAELSILVTDNLIVTEAKDWFDGLWNLSSAPVINEGDSLVDTINSLAWTKPRIRTKLSSSAPKVSAVLVSSPRPAGFDVAGTMARAVLQDSQRLESVENAYRAVSDDLFNSKSSFTFVKLVELIRTRTQKANLHDIWALLIKDTVNHWLGGLDIEGYDRYVFKDNQFHIFDRKTDFSEPATLVNFIVKKFPVHPAQTTLPIEIEWLRAGIPEHRIIPIVDFFVNTGLVIETDIPGELTHYSIDTKFDWPQRWDRFRDAKLMFNASRVPDTKPMKTVKAQPKPAPVASKSSLVNTMLNTIKNEITVAAKKANLTLEQYIVEQDEILVSLFEVIEDMGEQISFSRSELIKELRSKNVLESIIFTFSEPGLILHDNSNRTMRVNSRWNGSYVLHFYPRSLSIWERLSKRK